MKVGDKVSKGDLILSILSSDNKISPSKAIPKDTENLIQEAEKSLEKKQYKSMDIVHQVQSMSIETKIVSDSTSVEIMSRQFKLFSKLELKLRECIKNS